MEKDQGLITDNATLRGIVGRVYPIAEDKVQHSLDRFSRRFIELSPFLCLSTISAAGTADVSPRGDPAGFVKVLDDVTLLLPERPGNRRVDSMQNILANPSVAMIFFLPGVDETVRVGGKASIINDQHLLDTLVVRGQAPKLAIKVDITWVFFHCGKALLRSKLWDAGAQIKRDEFPTFGEIIHEQRLPEIPANEVEQLVQDDYKNSLY